MAERRMFARAIINSARFLRMPQTSRLLYYDLGMAADDDGVVEAFTVIRITGAAEDDLRVLASRGFIKVLNDDLVSYIADWTTNNQLRKDRYHPSVYSELLVKIQDGNQAATNGLPDGNQTETESSIGKASIGKESTDNTPADKPPVCRDFEKFWSAYPKKVAKKSAKKAFSRIKEPVETLLSAIERQKCSEQWSKDGGRYIPSPDTWLNGNRWEDELVPAAPVSIPKSGPNGFELVDDGKGGKVWKAKD